ncbi:DMT family transporter [Arenibaculum sp.]|uniref:DMT family transporter n=1 Tax=Arenibaculum sp. TaxID=2865862 RepID=UPI002E14176D|nr:DMT family transporter [Arenibaculum sp.]
MPEHVPPRVHPSAPSAALSGALWMIVSAVLFAVLNLLIRVGAEHLHPFQIAFFRCAFSLAFLTPWLVRTGFGGMRTGRLRLYLTRCLTGLCAMLTWFLGLSLMPLGTAVTLGFTTPLFATVGAALFLGEVVRRRRWTATAIGFLGVVIVIRPTPETLSLAALLVLFSAVLNAATALQVKSLARTEPTTAMVTYMALFLTPMSLVPALFVWQWPSWPVLGLMVVLGGIATLGQLAVTRAFHAADASALMPLDYVKLPISALLGWFAFGEVLDAWTWVGAAVIAGSTLYIAHREATLARRGR